MRAAWTWLITVTLTALAATPAHAQGLLPATPWSAATSQSPAGPQAAAGRNRPRPRAEPGTLLVRFEGDATPAERDTALRRADAAHPRSLRGSLFSLVSVAPGDRHYALRSLRRDPGVASAQPNYIRRAAAMPDDHMVVKGRQGWITTIRLPAAWDRVKATPAQVVAVLDTGVDLDHPDLDSQLLPGRDVVNQDDRPADDEGHGTAVAGIAAGRAGDGLGIAGVAWDASLLPVKVLGGAAPAPTRGSSRGSAGPPTTAPTSSTSRSGRRVLIRARRGRGLGARQGRPRRRRGGQRRLRARELPRRLARRDGGRRDGLERRAGVVLEPGSLDRSRRPRPPGLRRPSRAGRRRALAAGRRHLVRGAGGRRGRRPRRRPAPCVDGRADRAAAHELLARRRAPGPRSLLRRGPARRARRHGRSAPAAQRAAPGRRRRNAGPRACALDLPRRPVVRHRPDGPRGRRGLVRDRPPRRRRRRAHALPDRDQDGLPRAVASTA